MTVQPGRFKRTLKRAIGGSIVGGLLVVDMVGNGLLGGSFDETISSRAGRMARSGSYVAKGLCWALAKVDADHCNKAADNKGG